MNRQQTILIVEDDPNDQLFIQEAFRANGVVNPIRVENNGRDAIAYLTGEGRYGDREAFPYPGLILTDLKMPGGDGFMVLEHFKNNPQWAVVPTVVLTASNDQADVCTAYDLGASSYHQKPRGFESLREQLQILYNYWLTCLVPEVDSTGRRLSPQTKGKIGERFQCPQK